MFKQFNLHSKNKKEFVLKRMLPLCPEVQYLTTHDRELYGNVGFEIVEKNGRLLKKQNGSRASVKRFVFDP